MSTPNVGLYVPDTTTPVAPLRPVLAAMQGSTDSYLNRKGRQFANNAARDIAIASPVAGDFCAVGSGSVFEFQAYDGSAWQVVWSGESLAWVDLLADTGWISTGLTITPATDWSIVAYNLRKQGTRIHGIVAASCTKALNFNGSGNLSPDKAAFTLPTGWVNGGPFDTYMLVVRPNTLSMWATSDSAGLVKVTHGMPDRTLPANTTVNFYVDHDTN